MTILDECFFVPLEELFKSLFADKSDKPVSEWACESLWFDEPDNRGPFSLLGREYAREPLDSFADPSITDLVLIFGSQIGKTVIIMAGMAWIVIHESSRIFWVMPTKSSVENFSAKRWMKMLKRSPVFERLIPTGKDRHDFAKLQQEIGGAIIDLVWSNSPAALASTPARVVTLDELDKFMEASMKEADAMDLAEQRCKNFANPKRTKTTTPTIPEGMGWQEFIKTDQRRRQGPCPGCKKHVKFAWSSDFTVFPQVGNEAWAVWDKEAKRESGAWDLDRVERSARYQCPFCGFHIQDRWRTWVDRNGVWVPAEKRVKNGENEVKPAAGYRGYHLPSLWAPSPQCNVGKLAVKFLQKKGSLLGLQGFINGDLAEPFESQDTRGQRIEIIVRDTPKDEKGVKTIVSDVQQLSPHFWYTVWLWLPGVARIIDAGSCGTKQELHEIQKTNEIPDNYVCLDEAWDTANVREMCAERGKTVYTTERKEKGQPPLHVGWTPFRGFKTEGWQDAKSKVKSLVHLQPVDATVFGKRIAIPVLEMADGPLKDILARMRRGTTSMRLEIDERVSKMDFFWQHMDGERKANFIDKRTGFARSEWIKRSRHWPNHILDSCKGQIGFGLFHRLMSDIKNKE